MGVNEETPSEDKIFVSPPNELEFDVHPYEIPLLSDASAPSNCVFRVASDNPENIKSVPE